MLTVCSLRAVAVIANVLGRAGGRGQAKRKALAAGGQTTWHNPNDVEIFIEKEAREKLVDKLGKAKAAANGKVMHGGGEGEEKEGLSEEDAFFKAMLEGNDEGGSDFDDSDEDSDEDSDSDSDSDSDED